jgi:hypothetical protein
MAICANIFTTRSVEMTSLKCGEHNLRLIREDQQSINFDGILIESLFDEEQRKDLE